jgi:transposase
VDRALIDGEAVVRQVDGRSNFEALMTKRGGAQASLVACRRLMTIAGVGQLTALAFVAAIDVPSRIRRSRDIGAYLGLVPRRYQSGEVDYTGGISKCGDRRTRTLLYEAANVMVTRYKGQLKLKHWAFAIAKRSTMRKARVALARRLAIIMHAMLRDGTEFAPA